MKRKLFKPLLLKDGRQYAIGTRVEIRPCVFDDLSEMEKSQASTVSMADRSSVFFDRHCIVSIDGTRVALVRYTSVFKKPSDAAMRRAFFDGVAKTPSGKIVEPDGHDDLGFPAWSLILGIV